MGGGEEQEDQRYLNLGDCSFCPPLPSPTTTKRRMNEKRKTKTQKKNERKKNALSNLPSPMVLLYPFFAGREGTHKQVFLHDDNNEIFPFFLII